MKNPPFNSLVWGSLRLAPIIYGMTIGGGVGLWDGMTSLLTIYGCLGGQDELLVSALARIGSQSLQ